MAFRDYSPVPADNTALGDGTYIGPNMLRNKVRPALQALAADGKEMHTELSAAIATAVTGPMGPQGPSGSALNGVVNVSDFGFVGDGTTDNSNAMDTLLAFLVANGQVGHQTFYPGSYRIQFGRGQYYFSRDIHLKVPVIMEGVSTSLQDSPATWLDFATGGFVLHRYNTKKATSAPWAQLDSPATTGADGTIFRNLTLTSRQTRPADGVYNAQARDGILSFCRFQIENVHIRSFTRDGVAIDTNPSLITGVADLNANCCYINQLTSQWNGRHGLHLNSVDANACNVMNCLLDFNNNWGLHDDCFLTNHHWGHHAEGNGTKLDGAGSFSKSDALSSVCVYPATSGTVYYVSPGKTVQASTTQPGTDNTVWVKQSEGAGGATAGNTIPAWVSGMTWKDGGSYYFDTIQNGMVMNLYQEGSQGAPYFNQDGSVFLGGEMEKNPNSFGAYVYGGEGGYLRSNKGWGVQYLNPSTGHETRVVFGRDVDAATPEFLQIFDDTAFPGGGFKGEMFGGNIIFGAATDDPNLVLYGSTTGQRIPGDYATYRPVGIRMAVLGAGASRRGFTTGSAAPTTGTWAVGDRVYNDGSVTAIDTTDRWVCTVAGSPGTWVARS